MNNRTPKLVTFLFGAVIVLTLGGLAGWYFYLHSQETTTTAIDSSRGLGVTPPSFEGTSGSTQANQAIATQALSANSYKPSATSSSQLWEVDRTAVAGMGFVTSQADEHLYYVERANGYVFSAHPAGETTERLTDTLMPKVYEAQFSANGSVIERSVDAGGNVTTFLGTVSTSSSLVSSTSTTNVQRATVAAQTGATSSEPAILAGVYLEPNIRSIAVNPSSRALFYLIADPQGGVSGVTMQWNGSKRTRIFSSTIGSWQPSILADGTMVLLESPVDGLAGYAYTLSPTGVLSALVGDVAGLTILPKASSSYLVYGASSGNNLSLFMQATSTSARLPFATIASKCVWLPGKSEIIYCAVPNNPAPSNFLDGWYRGTANTSDDWWEMDLSSGASQRIYSPSANNVSLDVKDPIIDPSGNYIAFLNAKDRSLWVLRVAQ